MAQLRWYLATTQIENWQELSLNPQTAATLGNGWLVGTGATLHSEYSSYFNGDRATTTFVGTTVPDGTLDTSLKDAWRTGILNGAFAAGNWEFRFAVVGTVQAGAADGRIRFRLIRANADGSGATEITSGQQLSSLITNVATTDLVGTLTISLGALTFANQYLYVQVAWERTGAGGMTTSNVRPRAGVSATVGTTILSPDWTGVTQAITTAHRPGTVMIHADDGFFLPSSPTFSYELLNWASTHWWQSVSGIAGPVDTIVVWLERLPAAVNGTGVVLELRRDTRTGTVLATSTLLPEDLYEGFEFPYEFTFPTVTLLRTTTYWVGLSTVSDGGGSNQYSLQTTVNPYVQYDRGVLVYGASSAFSTDNFFEMELWSSAVDVGLRIEGGTKSVTTRSVASTATLHPPRLTDPSQKRWYLRNGVNAQGWQELTETPQAAATCACGWIVSTGATGYAEFYSNVERIATTFGGVVYPNGVLQSGSKDACRTPILNGKFAAGNWICDFEVIGVTSAGAADGQLRLRVIKAEVAGNFRETEITSQTATAAFTNIGTTAIRGTMVVPLPEVVLEEECLFFELAWQRTGAGSATTSNVRLRTGTDADMGTTILSPAFLDIAFVALPRIATPIVWDELYEFDFAYRTDNYFGFESSAGKHHGQTFHASERFSGIELTLATTQPYVGDLILEILAGGSIEGTTVLATALPVSVAETMTVMAGGFTVWLQTRFDFPTIDPGGLPTQYTWRLHRAPETYPPATYQAYTYGSTETVYEWWTGDPVDAYTEMFFHTRLLGERVFAPTVVVVGGEPPQAIAGAFIGGAGAAWAVVDSDTAAGPSGGAVTLSVTGAHCYVAAVSWYPGLSGIPQVSDANANAWTKYATYTDGPASTTLFLCPNPTPHVGDLTITLSGTQIYASFMAAAMSGSAVLPDQENGNGLIGGSIHTNPVTPAPGDLVFAGFTAGDGIGTLAIDSGYTLLHYVPYQNGLQMAGGLAWIVAPGGATDPLWTTGGGTNLSAAIASVQPVAVGGGGMLYAPTVAVVTGADQGITTLAIASTLAVTFPAIVALPPGAQGVTTEFWASTAVLNRPTINGGLAMAAGFATAHWTLDETSGNRVDTLGGLVLSEGNGSTGSTTGKFASAADFVVANARWLETPHTAAIRPPNGVSWTLRFWVKYTTRPVSSGVHLVSKALSIFDSSFIINLSGSSGYHILWVSNGNSSYTAIQNTVGEHDDPGVWYLIHASYDDGTRFLTLSVNASTAGNSQVALPGGTFSTNTAPLKIGRNSSLSSQWAPPMDGQIDDLVLLQNYVLSAEERAADYAAGAGLRFVDWGAPPAGDQTVSGVHIASTALVRVPTIVPGAVSLTLPTRSTTLQVNAPSVVPGAVTEGGATRPSTLQVFVPIVAVGSVSVISGHRPATVQIFVPSVGVGVTNVTTLAIATALQLFVPTVAAPIAQVTTAPRVTTLAVFAPALTVVAQGATIPPTSGLFAPSLRLNAQGASVVATSLVNAPTVQPAAITVLGGTVVATSGTTGPIVSQGAVTVLTPAWVASTALFLPTVLPQPVAVGGPTRPTTIAVTAPSLAVGSIAITLAHRSATTTMNAPTLTVGAVGITLPTRATTAAVFAPVLSAIALGATIPRTSGAFAPTLTATVTLTTLASTAQMNAPGVAGAAAQAVTTVAVATTAVLSLPIVGLAGVSNIGAATRLAAAVLFGVSLSVGPVGITAASVSPTSVARVPSLTMNVSTATRTPAAVLSAPALAGTVTTATRPTTAAVFAPTLTGRVLLPALGPGSALFPPATLPIGSLGGPTAARSTQVYALTVQAGVVLVGAAHIPVTSDVTRPTLGVGLVAGTCGPTGVLYPPVLTVGASTVVLARIGLTSAAFAPLVGVGATQIGGATVVGTTALYAPAMVARLDGIFIGSTAQSYPLTVRAHQAVTGATAPAGSQTFALAILAVTPVAGPTCPSSLAIFAPQIPSLVTTPLLGSTLGVFAPAFVEPEIGVITVGGLGPTTAVHAPVVLRIGDVLPEEIHDFTVGIVRSADEQVALVTACDYTVALVPDVTTYQATAALVTEVSATVAIVRTADVQVGLIERRGLSVER